LKLIEVEISTPEPAKIQVSLPLLFLGSFHHFLFKPLKTIFFKIIKDNRKQDSREKLDINILSLELFFSIVFYDFKENKFSTGKVEEVRKEGEEELKL